MPWDFRTAACSAIAWAASSAGLAAIGPVSGRPWSKSASPSARSRSWRFMAPPIRWSATRAAAPAPSPKFPRSLPTGQHEIAAAIVRTRRSSMARSPARPTRSAPMADRFAVHHRQGHTRLESAAGGTKTFGATAEIPALLCSARPLGRDAPTAHREVPREHPLPLLVPRSGPLRVAWISCCPPRRPTVQGPRLCGDGSGHFHLR